MKKLFLYLVVISSLVSCDDGDIIVTTFDFDEVTLQNCGGAGGYLFYKINDASTESLSLRLGTTDQLFTESSVENFVLDESTNFVNYRVFNAEVSSAYFCNQVPPTSPTIVDEYLATSGTATLTTATLLEDNDNVPFVDSDDDLAEGFGDLDNDLILNYYDEDDDGDNVPTINELDTENADGDNDPLTNPKDTDGDGTPDYLDTDDDGDGVPTIDEANGTLDPLNYSTDPSGLPNFLNKSISEAVQVESYYEHTYTFESNISLLLENIVLNNGTETITRESLSMGDIDTILSGSFEVIPPFNN